jgi:hypothetical protein
MFALILVLSSVATFAACLFARWNSVSKLPAKKSNWGLMAVIWIEATFFIVVYAIFISKFTIFLVNKMYSLNNIILMLAIELSLLFLPLFLITLMASMHTLKWLFHEPSEAQNAPSDSFFQLSYSAVSENDECEFAIQDADLTDHLTMQFLTPTIR